MLAAVVVLEQHHLPAYPARSNSISSLQPGSAIVTLKLLRAEYTTVVPKFVPVQKAPATALLDQQLAQSKQDTPQPVSPPSEEAIVAPLTPPSEVDPYRNAEELDMPALPLADLEQIFNQVFFLVQDRVLLELLIDANGTLVSVTCLDGTCRSDITDKLAAIKTLQFEPAIKDGLPTASRKLIEIVPRNNIKF